MRILQKQLRRGVAFGLAAALSLCVAAPAAEPDRTAQRREDLDVLYRKVLAETHPNAFSKTPEPVFLQVKAEIESRLETESDVTFALDLMRLTALAGDSHTTLGSTGELTAQMRAYPMGLTWRNEKWYLSAAPEKEQALLGREVTALNGKSVEETVSAFGKLLSADNPVKLRRGFRQSCMLADFYEYLDLVKPGQPLRLTLDGGRTLSLASVPMAELEQAGLAQLGARISARAATAAADVNYFGKPLTDAVYYIQYNVCQEDPELPMDTFAAQVQKDLEGGSFRRILVDLRNNGGGSDGVIWPLLEVLRQAAEQGTELVGLIGETTFSSAIINAVELQEMGGVLVGEPASGSVSHFGAVQSARLPHSKLRVGVSTRWIDLNTVLDAGAGRGVVALEPDVEVYRTMEDTLTGRDTAVEWLLAHPEQLHRRAYPDAPLTRGRLMGLIYEAMGSPAGKETALPFADCFGIEWYLPALRWGRETGIAKGGADGRFAAARPVTWQEAAVFLERAVSSLGGSRETVRSGLLPAGADWSKTPTRAQGEAMAAALAQFVRQEV